MKTKSLRLQKWPFVPSNPAAWQLVLAAWPKGKKLGFVGHDGYSFYFQNTGDSTPVVVAMTPAQKQSALSALMASDDFQNFCGCGA